MFYKDVGKQTHVIQMTFWFDRNVTRDLQEPKPVFPLGAVVLYVLVQCLGSFVNITTANDKNSVEWVTERCDCSNSPSKTSRDENKGMDLRSNEEE